MQHTFICMFVFFLSRKVEGGIDPQEALDFDWLILFDGLVKISKSIIMKVLIFVTRFLHHAAAGNRHIFLEDISQ